MKEPKMLSDLPRDLVEDVFSRLPVKSRIALRSTSKKWNSFWSVSNAGSLITNKYLREAKQKQFVAVMVIDYRVYSIEINLNKTAPVINRQAQLVSLIDSKLVHVYKAFHCDGLLLVVMNDLRLFVVWNPYLGQTRCFDHTVEFELYRYAIGYENSKACRSHKVLRFVQSSQQEQDIRYEVYYLDNSRSPKNITILTDWAIGHWAQGVSVKGNTYWVASEEYQGYVSKTSSFLICFDFTREKFGPRLALPLFQSDDNYTLTLSSVRDEQLAVLIEHNNTLRMDIWVSSKIEPQMVSWGNLFLSVDMGPLGRSQNHPNIESFFVDEEKKVAVAFGKDTDTVMRNSAYVIGEHGYFEKADMGKSPNTTCYPLLCSYVPY